LDSNRTEAVLPGILINNNFAISPDGEIVAFESTDAIGTSHVWEAPLDRRAAPKQLTPSDAYTPSFGPWGRIYFRMPEGNDQFLYSVQANKDQLQKMSPDPVRGFVSPHGDWWVSGLNPIVAHPVQRGASVNICNACSLGWGADGNYFYVRFRDVGEMGGGKTIAIALPPGKELPDLPPSGYNPSRILKG